MKTLHGQKINFGFKTLIQMSPPVGQTTDCVITFLFTYTGFQLIYN